MDDWHLWTSYFPKNIPLWFDRKILYGDLVKSHPWLQIKLNEKFHLNARMMFQKPPQTYFCVSVAIGNKQYLFSESKWLFWCFCFQKYKIQLQLREHRCMTCIHKTENSYTVIKMMKFRQATSKVYFGNNSIICETFLKTSDIVKVFSVESNCEF